MAVGMTTTTALTNHSRSNAVSVDAMPAWITVQKTIFIAHDVPAEPRFLKRPQVVEGEGAIRTARTGINPTNAPVAWHDSVPVKPKMSSGPVSVNGALIVRINAVAADPQVAKIARLDLQYVPRPRKPPSAPVGVGEIQHQQLHPKPKAPSLIQPAREGERPQAAPSVAGPDPIPLP